MKIKFIFIWITLIIITNNIYSSNSNISSQSIDSDSLYLTKTSGICFRIDDNSDISDYMKLAEIFNKYDAKFCISLNLNGFNKPNYADSIKMIQDMGHEIMDHTPNHRTNYFTTKFSIPEYYQDQNLLAGIDHIHNDKVCLEFEKTDSLLATRSGICNIASNTVFGDFSNLTASEIYIYFPEIDKLARIKTVNANSLTVLDVWEDDITLPTLDNTKYFTFTKYIVTITTDAVKVLANESQKLAKLYNIEPPKVWIQPGGNFPELRKDRLNEALSGGELNYVAGAASQKEREVYNEYDPNGSEKFGMQWGDFFEDITSADSCIKIIADRTAKHYVQIGHAHFYAIKSLDRYFEKVDSILAWAQENNVPVRTYSEWADILYNQKPDPYVNMFPSLSVDRDKNISELSPNGIPDGYEPRFWKGEGLWSQDTIINGESKYCYTVTGGNRLCRIEKLAGLEKGKNEFKIETKGAAGDSIEVTFIFSTTSGLPDKVFKFPADTKDWTEYSLIQSTNGNTELIIPETEVFISVDIKCSNYVSGEVKISNMYLAKAKMIDGVEEITEMPNKFTLNQNYPNPFNPSTKISYTLPEKSSVTLKIYDILGREVTTLFNGKQNVGSYQFDFDASNLSSGIYFYSLNAGEFHQTKKMILIK